MPNDIEIVENRNNWAENYAYTAPRILAPATAEELQDLVANSDKVHALGTRHCFNDIADTPGTLISMEKFDGVVGVGHNAVTVKAGTKYGDLCKVLDEAGFALPNLASLPHISVAGACATATHGSGDRTGNLSTAVSGMQVVLADGSLRELSRQTVGDEFDGLVVHLGGLGIVTEVTLDLIPSFRARQNVFEKLPHFELREHFPELMSAAYSVSLFTEWKGDYVDLAWVKSLASAPSPGDRFFGAKPASADRNPVPFASPENCNPQMGEEGPWFERLPHFRMEFTPSMGEELQTEYFVAREDGLNAFFAVDALRDRIAPLAYLSEIRSIAADDLWMSPAYHRDCIAIHFTWKKNWAGVGAMLPVIEEALKPFDARPHWGKTFTMSPDRIQSLYPKHPDFVELLHKYDPSGKFRNTYLQRNIL